MQSKSNLMMTIVQRSPLPSGAIDLRQAAGGSQVTTRDPYQQTTVGVGVLFLVLKLAAKSPVMFGFSSLASNSLFGVSSNGLFPVCFSMKKGTQTRLCLRCYRFTALSARRGGGGVIKIFITDLNEEHKRRADSGTFLLPVCDYCLDRLGTISPL